LEPESYTAEFRTKCQLKKLEPREFFKKLAQKIPLYKGQWQKSLEDQIRELPDFDRVEREVLRNLKKFKP